ncbi:MAG: hypothetical protein QOG06_2208, partial [Gaiellaceae bacterium]|nr:hypothetical protein [Gaiellaceae bacterium]
RRVSCVDERIERGLARARELGEQGLQVAAYLDGEQIVDAWTGDGVDGSTLFPIFSVTKAITATAVHLQAERGLVEYDAPLARYWPEYGTRGKEAVTVRQVLSHRAGVPQMPVGVTPQQLTDWDWMVERLTEVEPLAEPGTRNTYLSMTFGWLLGEVVRRTDPQHRPFGRFVREEICEPLGMDSFWIGVPPAEQARISTLTFPEPPPEPPPGAPVLAAVPPQVRLTPELLNRPEIQGACLPAVGGISNARSLVRFFAMIANGGELDGVRLLSEERVLSFLEPRPDFDAHDDTYGRRMPVGVGGFWIESPGVTGAESEGHRLLGHTGAGGSIAWADLDTGLSIAFCHDRMLTLTGEHPFAALADAVRAVAADRS